MKLEDMEALEKNATKGPWAYCYDGSSDWSVGLEKDPQANQIASCHRWHAVENPDAKFIAASRELMPKLLAVAKAAKKMQVWYSNDHSIDCCCNVCDVEPSLNRALEKLEKE